MSSKKVETKGEDFYGLKIFRINDKEYAIGTPEQAESAAIEMARECLDLIDVELLLKHSGLPLKAKALFVYLEGGCEPERQPAIASLMNDVDALVKEAVEVHGRAYFLGIFDEGIEFRLSQFPKWCVDFILADLKLDSAEQVCMYRM